MITGLSVAVGLAIGRIELANHGRPCGRLPRLARRAVRRSRRAVSRAGGCGATVRRRRFRAGRGPIGRSRGRRGRRRCSPQAAGGTGEGADESRIPHRRCSTSAAPRHPHRRGRAARQRHRRRRVNLAARVQATAGPDQGVRHPHRRRPRRRVGHRVPRPRRARTKLLWRDVCQGLNAGCPRLWRASCRSRGAAGLAVNCWCATRGQTLIRGSTAAGPGFVGRASAV